MRTTKIYLYVLVGFILLYAYLIKKWKKTEEEYLECIEKYKAK